MNVNINNTGGTVIITPPYRSKAREWHKGWSKRLRIGKLYFYVSNCRMKKRPIRDLMYTGGTEDHCKENKHKLYERQGGYALFADSRLNMIRWNCTTYYLSLVFLNLGNRYATASCFVASVTKRYTAIRSRISK